MKKKICALVAFIIILGTVLIFTIGLNVNLRYSAHTLVEAYVGQEFKMSDMKAITNEVFPKAKVEIESASEYKDMVCISVEGITDEQKDLLCQKINEKYNSDITKDDISVKQISNTRLRDILTPYVVPVIIATIISIAYMAIVYRKLGVVNIILQTGGLAVTAEWLFLAILAITRYPIDGIIIPATLIIYFAVLIFLNLMYGKNMSGIQEKKENKRTKGKK